MSKPLALSDDQMSCILRMAAPLAIDHRANFLHDVARELDGRELGDAVVARTCAEIQKRYWRAPDLSRSIDCSKYRR